MTQNNALAHLRAFRHLNVPFAEATTQDQEVGANGVSDEMKQHASDLIDGFHDSAEAYHNICEHVLTCLTIKEFLTQDETDKLSAAHLSDLNAIESFFPSLKDHHAVICPHRLSSLVDASPTFKEAWNLIKAGNKIVDIMNDPQHVQRLRDETPARMSRIAAFCQQRYEAFQTGLQSAHEAATFWNYEQETLDVRQRFVMNRVAQWWRRKQGVRAPLENLKYTLPVSLHKDLDPEHPSMVAGTRLKEQTDEMFVDLYDNASADEAEDVNMDEEESSIEGMEEDGNESEWEEFVLEEDTTPPPEEWTDEELDDLKDRLGQPFPVIITGEKKYEERPRYERHVLDNHCVICVDDIDDPCMLSTCDHVFCYKCIVHALRTGKPCPTCQQPGQLDDLTPLDVTIVEATEEMDVDGGDHSSTTEIQNEQGAEEK